MFLSILQGTEVSMKHMVADGLAADFYPISETGSLLPSLIPCGH